MFESTTSLFQWFLYISTTSLFQWFLYWSTTSLFQWFLYISTTSLFQWFLYISTTSLFQWFLYLSMTSLFQWFLYWGWFCTDCPDRVQCRHSCFYDTLQGRQYCVCRVVPSAYWGRLETVQKHYFRLVYDSTYCCWS